MLDCGVPRRQPVHTDERELDRIESDVANKGSVALFLASHRGCNNIVQALLNAKCRGFDPQPSGRTPLLMAAKSSKFETVDLLLGILKNISVKLFLEEK